jgi:hypothetical protein
MMTEGTHSAWFGPNGSPGYAGCGRPAARPPSTRLRLLPARRCRTPAAIRSGPNVVASDDPEVLAGMVWDGLVHRLGMR